MPTARSAELAQTVGSFEAKLDALKTADAVITIGVDLSRNHQVAGFFAKRIRPQGVPLIVIDPNENGLDPIADVALKPEAGQGRGDDRVRCWPPPKAKPSAMRRSRKRRS